MLILFRLLSKLPLRVLHAFGAMLGWLAYLASSSYRRLYRNNARIADVPWPVARQGVAEAGRLIAELPWLWLRPHEQALGNKLQWRGAELIEQGLAAGRGLVFLTPHLGCFEMTAQAFVERFAAAGPITVLYRPARQAWLRRVMDDSRVRPGLETAPANLAGVRQMIRALRKGQSIGLLPDQVPPHGQGVWAPFFGRSAYTMTLAARLLQQTGATPLLIWGERLPKGRGYVVHVLQAPMVAADLPAEFAAATINQSMEHLIRQAPHQYLWGYNRYKQPRGQAVAAAPALDPKEGA